ncbi:MAG: HD domain-containing protein [Lachnospiraceae bacterium]|nr:HD domain-containing protein [Lachnospiraceae bacterium]
MLEFICGAIAGAGTILVSYMLVKRLRPAAGRSKARDIILEEMQEPIVLFDMEDVLLDFNKEAADKFGLEKQNLRNMTRETFINDILQLKYEPSPNLLETRDFVYRMEYAEIVYRLDILEMKFQNGMKMGRLYVFHDVTKQKRMYNALENMSTFHTLTGFYTSRAFEQRLEELDKKGQHVILGICNISGLKLLNRLYGRKLGDRIVQVMSEALRAVLPEQALAAYTEDDHVVVAADGISEEQMKLYLENAARKIRQKALPRVPVFMNYGVACRENTAVPSTEYIKYAEMDMILKKAKEGEEQKQLMTEALTEEYFRKNYESREHVERITEHGLAMADRLGLPEKEKRRLKLLCRYHDIGRVLTREEIWGQPSIITKEEFDIIKLHAITGYQTASELWLDYEINDLILYHHENYDGTGYPYGLKGEEIPLLSRILAIVDSYDIMSHDQLYKGAVSEETAMDELRKFSGTQFDPALVTLFEECVRKGKKGL